MTYKTGHWGPLAAAYYGSEEDTEQFKGVDRFDFLSNLAFYVDIGSMFDIVRDEQDANKIRETLTAVRSVCGDNWHWTLNEFATYTVDPEGKSTLPCGTQVRIKDLRRQLWINFASADDAMLCRLAISELRSGQHVERGRVSGEFGNS